MWSRERYQKKKYTELKFELWPSLDGESWGIACWVGAGRANRQSNAAMKLCITQFNQFMPCFPSHFQIKNFPLDSFLPANCIISSHSSTLYFGTLVDLTVSALLPSEDYFESFPQSGLQMWRAERMSIEYIFRGARHRVDC